MNTEYIDEPASQRTNTSNNRTYQRNIPSEPLQPYLSSIPAPTKYLVMPIIDERKQSKVPVKQMPTYNVHKTFNPGDRGPWSGFASNVNKESVLRNQIFALQSCSQATYVPTSKSDLYQVHWKEQIQVQQPFPDLFRKQTFPTEYNSTQNSNIGYALFNNATRQQNKEANVGC